MHLISSPPTSQTDPSKTYIWSCDFPPPSPSLVSITPGIKSQSLPCSPRSCVTHLSSQTPRPPILPLAPCSRHTGILVAQEACQHMVISGSLCLLIVPRKPFHRPVSCGSIRSLNSAFFSAFRLCSNVITCWEWRAQSIYNWTAIMISY